MLKEVAHGWIIGKSFNELLKIIHKRKAKMIWGTRRREFKIDHVVDVCEGALAYDGALLVGALCEFIETLDQDGTEEVINHLQTFQKRIKYGLPTRSTIKLHEIGFSDRVVAQELDAAIRPIDGSNYNAKNHLRVFQGEALGVLANYPSYFTHIYGTLLE